MYFKFKRHDKVKLLSAPDPEYTEYYSEEEKPILAGALGTVNVILPNGKYHIRIEDENQEESAYVVMDEESLQAI